MEIILQSLGFKASTELEAYTQEKVNKLEHKLNNVIRANVTLFIGPESEHENKFCEIRLEIPGNDPFVKRNAESFELAITDAVKTLDNLLSKVREKQFDRRP